MKKLLKNVRSKCNKKPSFLSREEAKKAASILWETKKEDLRPFHCSCDQYHLTDIHYG